MAWELSRGVRWLHVDDGLTVLAPGAGRFVELDAAGAHLFDLLDVARWDAGAAGEALARLHGLPPEEAEEIISCFARGLETQGVISAVQ